MTASTRLSMKIRTPITEGEVTRFAGRGPPDRQTFTEADYTRSLISRLLRHFSATQVVVLHAIREEMAPNGAVSLHQFIKHPVCTPPPGGGHRTRRGDPNAEGIRSITSKPRGQTPVKSRRKQGLHESSKCMHHPPPLCSTSPSLTQPCRYKAEGVISSLPLISLWSALLG